MMLPGVIFFFLLQIISQRSLLNMLQSSKIFVAKQLYAFMKAAEQRNIKNLILYY